MRKQEPWIRLLYCCFDIRIAFIILKHRIVLRRILFNKITFKYKRFYFRICKNIFKTCYLAYHPFNFRRYISGRPENTGSTLFLRFTAFPTYIILSILSCIDIHRDYPGSFFSSSSKQTLYVTLPIP